MENDFFLFEPPVSCLNNIILIRCCCCCCCCCCAEILDDIDGRMDQANTRLIKETHHVKRITAKSSTCGKLHLKFSHVKNKYILFHVNPFPAIHVHVVVTFKYVGKSYREGRGAARRSFATLQKPR